MQYNVLVYRKLRSLNKGTDSSKFQYLITEGTYIHRVQAKYTAVQKQPSRYHSTESTDKATARVNCSTSLCLQTDLLPIPSALDLQHHCWWKMAVCHATRCMPLSASNCLNCSQLPWSPGSSIAATAPGTARYPYLFFNEMSGQLLQADAYQHFYRVTYIHVGTIM